MNLLPYGTMLTGVRTKSKPHKVGDASRAERRA